MIKSIRLLKSIIPLCGNSGLQHCTIFCVLYFLYIHACSGDFALIDIAYNYIQISHHHLILNFTLLCFFSLIVYINKVKYVTRVIKTISTFLDTNKIVLKRLPTIVNNALSPSQEKIV